MMNTQAMGILVSQIAPSIDRWFPDMSQLEAALPAATIDHSAEPLYQEVWLGFYSYQYYSLIIMTIITLHVQRNCSFPVQVPKWGESVWEARSRYASVIKALADKYPDENLLLVTHGEFGVIGYCSCVAVPMETYY
jgi:broad specificity phosphatase PhoE